MVKKGISDEDKCSGGTERAASLIVTRDYAALLATRPALSQFKSLKIRKSAIFVTEVAKGSVGCC